MFLSLVTLFVALTISAVSAYYSIVGLTAIFSAAFWPIVIMGSALEAGKIVSTVWLHYYWEKASFRIKAYLVPAVVILMIITSLGVFGFLSKSHADAGMVSGDVLAKVQLYNERIKTQRDNIEVARKALAQMDGSVDQVLSRSTDERGASKASDLRRSQARERAKLQNEIDQAQKVIATLQEERAPIASQVRKVEAEVGPIKYIAALIYGDTADQNLLEAAVRWVIIIIVSVFDPLAIVLILAATTSLDWARSDRERKKREKALNDIAENEAHIASLVAKKEVMVAEQAALAEEVALLEEAKETVEQEIKQATFVPDIPHVEPEVPDYDLIESEIKKTLTQLEQEHNEKEALAAANKKLAEELATAEADRDELADILEKVLKDLPPTPVVEDEQPEPQFAEEEYTGLSPDNEWPFPDSTLTNPLPKSELRDDLISLFPAPTYIVEEEPAYKTEEEKREIAKMAFDAVFRDRPDYFVTKEVPDEVIDSYNEERLVSKFDKLGTEEVKHQAKEETLGTVENKIAEDLVEDEHQRMEREMSETLHALGEHGLLPEQTGSIERPGDYIIDQDLASLRATDKEPTETHADFGTVFPTAPNKGDMFLRVDYFPSKLFKWNDAKWIEVDKDATASYTYNEQYIQMLINKISSGEYDVEDLTEAEHEQIQQFLSKK